MFLVSNDLLPFWSYTSNLFGKISFSDFFFHLRYFSYSYTNIWILEIISQIIDTLNLFLTFFLLCFPLDTVTPSCFLTERTSTSGLGPAPRGWVPPAQRVGGLGPSDTHTL